MTSSSPYQCIRHSSGYLRSKSHAAAVQYRLRASAAARIVVSKVCLKFASSFFSPSHNALCSLPRGFPIHR